MSGIRIQKVFEPVEVLQIDARVQDEWMVATSDDQADRPVIMVLYPIKGSDHGRITGAKVQRQGIEAEDTRGLLAGPQHLEAFRRYYHNRLHPPELGPHPSVLFVGSLANNGHEYGVLHLWKDYEDEEWHLEVYPASSAVWGDPDEYVAHVILFADDDTEMPINVES